MTPMTAMFRTLTEYTGLDAAPPPAASRPPTAKGAWMLYTKTTGMTTADAVRGLPPDQLCSRCGREPRLRNQRWGSSVRN
jgi:hypothetical protein